MFSLGIASLNVLMMLTVSMTVSHLYQNLELTSNLFKASEGVNYRDKRAKSLCRRPLPPPWFAGGDHLCPYGRKLIGSLVLVHNRRGRVRLQSDFARLLYRNN